jgi:hypothetical protein
MPVQSSTDYQRIHKAAFEGMKVALGLVNIDSKVLESTSTAFGLAVVEGTDWDQAKVPSSAADKFIGVSLYTTAGIVEIDGFHGYHANKEMDILTFGKIWVRTEAAVVKGDPVFFRHTATGDEVLGAFRNGDDSGDCTIVQGATFERPASAGELSVIDLRPQGLLNPPVFVEYLTDETAISTDIKVTSYTTGGAVAATLADGIEGQEKVIKLTFDGGTVTLEPANLADGTTITFADVNDAVSLVFIGGAWAITSNEGAVVA